MSRFSWMSLRSRILLITLVTVFGALGTGTVAVVTLLWQSEKAHSVDALRVLGQMAGDRLSGALASGDATLMRDNLAFVGLHPGLRKACLYLPDGELKAEFLDTRDESPCSEREPERMPGFGATRFGAVVPVTHAGRTWGHLLMLSDYSALQRRALDIMIAACIAFAVAVSVAWVMARRLQGIVSRPLDVLSETAHRITESNDYATRAPAQDAGREIDRLVTAFNHMMRRINREHSALTASERRFRTLTENSPVGIFETDANGEFCYANEQFATILGIPAPTVSLVMADLRLKFEDGQRFSEKWLRVIHSSDDFMLAFRRANEPDADVTVVGRAMPLHDEHGIVSGYLGSLTDVTELELARSKLEHLAFFDPLTNLANRRMIIGSIAQEIALAERGDYQFALLILDLDQFKRVNDTFGHDAGDVLLKVCAERLVGCVRPSDVVARQGGDEFLVLLKNIRQPEEATAVASRILSSFRNPVVIGSQQVIVTSSIGITLGVIDGRDPQTLMKNADLAMYNAKAAGRNAFRFFDDEMGRSLREQLAIENDLRSAIEHDQFCLYLQPQIALNNYHMVGVEALVRWQHPFNGLVPPALFIPVAEATGLIIPLGRWIIREACRLVVQMKESGVFPDLQKISINLSPKQFHDSKLMETLELALTRYGAKPQWLEFEITESVLMEDSQRSLAILERLRETGVGLAVDDFGTGYSSLSYLKRFPIDTLKIDRSFVMDIPDDRSDMEISAAVIAMAHKLDLRVVAEGVETEAQLRFLEDNHCDVCQGYLFARPMSLAVLMDNRARAQSEMASD